MLNEVACTLSVHVGTCHLRSVELRSVKLRSAVQAQHDDDDGSIQVTIGVNIIYRNCNVAWLSHSFLWLLFADVGVKVDSASTHIAAQFKDRNQHPQAGRELAMPCPRLSRSSNTEVCRASSSSPTSREIPLKSGRCSCHVCTNK